MCARKLMLNTVSKNAPHTALLRTTLESICLEVSKMRVLTCWVLHHYIVSQTRASQLPYSINQSFFSQVLSTLRMYPELPPGSDKKWYPDLAASIDFMRTITKFERDKNLDNVCTALALVCEASAKQLWTNFKTHWARHAITLFRQWTEKMLTFWAPKDKKKKRGFIQDQRLKLARDEALDWKFQEIDLYYKYRKILTTLGLWFGKPRLRFALGYFLLPWVANGVCLTSCCGHTQIHSTLDVLWVVLINRA